MYKLENGTDGNAGIIFDYIHCLHVLSSDRVNWVATDGKGRPWCSLTVEQMPH